MDTSKLFVASVMVAAASAALTSTVWADESQPLSRAEVTAAVVQARADGQLRPAGEAAEQYRAPMLGSERARAQVLAEVLEARKLGQLIPAGQGIEPFVQAGGTTVTRREVQSEVQLARSRNELIPAGEGFGPIERVKIAARAFSTKVAADASR